MIIVPCQSFNLVNKNPETNNLLYRFTRPFRNPKHLSKKKVTQIIKVSLMLWKSRNTIRSMKSGQYLCVLPVSAHLSFKVKTQMHIKRARPWRLQGRMLSKNLKALASSSMTTSPRNRLRSREQDQLTIRITFWGERGISKREINLVKNLVETIINSKNTQSRTHLPK